MHTHLGDIKLVQKRKTLTILPQNYKPRQLPAPTGLFTIKEPGSAHEVRHERAAVTRLCACVSVCVIAGLECSVVVADAVWNKPGFCTPVCPTCTQTSCTVSGKLHKIVLKQATDELCCIIRLKWHYGINLHVFCTFNACFYVFDAAEIEAGKFSVFSYLLLH